MNCFYESSFIVYTSFQDVCQVPNFVFRPNSEDIFQTQSQSFPKKENNEGIHLDGLQLTYCHPYQGEFDMATWIVHLRIAEALLARIPALDASAFSAGSIAPDSGVPDEKWEHFDPPPAVTHFYAPDHFERRIPLEDLRFYRAYLSGLPPAADPAKFGLRWGYFFHLLTDNLWWIEIDQPTRARWAEQFAADPGFIWTVKEDWYGLDFVYLRGHPDSLFWRVFANLAEQTHDLDFLPAGALTAKIAYIQGYYQNPNDMQQAYIKQNYPYLSQVEVDSFVMRVAERCAAAFNLLQDGCPTLDGHTSILELLDI
jgi:hypothetical protein